MSSLSPSSSAEINSLLKNDHRGGWRFAKAARGSGRKGAKVFRLFEPATAGEFKKNQRLHRNRNVRFAAPKHFCSTFFALEKSGISAILQRFVCKAGESVYKFKSWFSSEAGSPTSSAEINSLLKNDHRGGWRFAKAARGSGRIRAKVFRLFEPAVAGEFKKNQRLHRNRNVRFAAPKHFCSTFFALEKSGIKSLLFLALSLLSFQLFAQQPLTVVTKTSASAEIRVKWLPTNYDAMRSLIKEGCTVERVELSGTTAPTANYATAEKILMAPAQARLSTLNASDTAVQRIVTILDPFTAATAPTTKESRDFAFALAVLELTVSDALSAAVGCQLTVKGEKGKRYGFRITVKGLPVVYAEVNTDEVTSYPAITDFAAKLDRKKAVELTWMAKSYQQYGYAFHIEKSLDAPTPGNHLTKTAYFPMRTQYEKENKQDFYRDEVLQEGKTHYYRLIGLNYFGEEAYFSEWQKIYVPRHLNAEVYIDTVYADKQTRVVAGTAYRLSHEPMNLKAFVLLRSDKRDGTYTMILQKTTTDTSFRFTVDMLKTGDQFYYKVAAVSIDNDTVYSTASYLFTLDQEPPSKPTGLTGTINEKGIVSLSWVAPSDNDVQGYRIFRANHKREDFVERTTDLSTATNYTDTVLLNNLTPEVYYCVKAVDRNFNNSPFSDTILVLKPDTIAPVAALLGKPVMQDTVIRLSWINSPSEDVAKNMLVRISGTVIDTLLRWSDSTTVFTDTKIIPGTSYRYVTLTADKTGNRSEGASRQFYYEPGYRKALTGFKAEVRPQEKLVRLTWTPPVGEVFSYQIYKATGEGKLMLLKTIEDPAATFFEDKQVSSGKWYKYTIKYTLKSGIQGLPTKEVVVGY